MRVVPWPPPRAGSGVPSGGGCLCVCQERGSACFGELSPESSPDPRAGRLPGPLSALRGWARRTIKLYPSRRLPACVGTGSGAGRGMLHCFRSRLRPRSSKVPGGPLAGPVHKLAPRAGGRRPGSRQRGAKVTSYSESQGFGGCLSQLLLFSLAGRDRGVSV